MKSNFKSFAFAALAALAIGASAQSIPASSADSGSRAVVAITPMSSGDVTNIVRSGLSTGAISVPSQGVTPWTLKFAGRSWPNVAFTHRLPNGAFTTPMRNLTFNWDGSISAQRIGDNQWFVLYTPNFQTANSTINLSTCISPSNKPQYGTLLVLTPTGNVQTGAVTGWILQNGVNSISCTVHPSVTFSS